MKPIKTSTSNTVMKLPGGTDENDLPIEQIWEDGRTINISTWELSHEERRALLSGAVIELWLWGNGHPPVGLQVKGIHGEEAEADRTTKAV
jgi:hypothetical protein